MKWIDLAHLLNSETPPYPGDPRPVLRQTRMLERDGYNAYELHTGLHAGTHVDLPMHLLDDPRTADRFAPELFCGRGQAADLRGQRRSGGARGTKILWKQGMSCCYGPGLTRCSIARRTVIFRSIQCSRRSLRSSLPCAA